MPIYSTRSSLCAFSSPFPPFSISFFRAAVSYGRLTEIEIELRAEVAHFFELGEGADQGETKLPQGLVIEDEITFRKERLENLAKAKAVLDVRAKERYEVEKAE